MNFINNEYIMPMIVTQLLYNANQVCIIYTYELYNTRLISTALYMIVDRIKFAKKLISFGVLSVESRFYLFSKIINQKHLKGL